MSAICPDCKAEFTRSDNMRRHVLTQHGPSSSTPPPKKEVSHPIPPPPPPSSEEVDRKIAARQRELETRVRENEEQRKTVESKAAEVTRREEAAKRRETELLQRERAAREFEESSAADRLRREIARFKDELPSFEEGEIVRFDGRDFRVEGEKFRHVYFPDGEKHELEEGDLFCIAETVYWARSGEIVRLSSGEIAETILEQEAEDSAESAEAEE